MNEEIKRIEENNNGELPKKTKIIITVKNVENPTEVLTKTKEIVKIIASYGYTRKPWPTDESWKTILPLWFVESMTTKSLDEIMKTKGQWHFESWVESMANRAVVWWSSKIENNTITIVLETLNIPYIYEQFLYIFYAQGISLNNISDIDDIYGETFY
jgi:hypothetical protein